MTAIVTDWPIGAIAPSLMLLAETLTEPVSSMPLWQAVVIGIVQGFTEFLPISSTAHVKIIPVLLGWGDPGVAFTAVIQLGSIAAMLWYFWDDLSQVTLNMVRATQRRDWVSVDFRLGLGILLGTVPIVFFGLLVKVFVPNYDESILRSTAAIAIASIVMALFLAAAEQWGQRGRGFDKLGLWDGIWMGIAQALAIIPGVSRSGSTLTAGLFMGLERSTAARFSFLLGVPAITLAGLVELKDLLESNMAGIGWLSLIGGLAAAVVSSYAAIAWLIEFLKSHSTWVFVWYRLGFGVALLAAIALQLMQNV
ncbi:undecaprenyl-diphosphate phosphatase [Leptolyngbya sp. PCC 6406]|uniref:undecaprenyl-diphosphate phosphatase n=1 Tax=Leptolyngbya sp. PCC 6406 TaxID=1173264 RepID=UPI0002ABA2CD|nr:undecaprenyl-diphosphate phosphatase [Leptolyngbya sp. PCC 6406]